MHRKEYVTEIYTWMREIELAKLSRRAQETGDGVLELCHDYHLLKRTT